MRHLTWVCTKSNSPFQPPQLPRTPPRLPQIPRNVPTLPLPHPVLVFLAALLGWHDAGVANEWEQKLPEKDERRYRELEAKRSKEIAQGGKLPPWEEEEFQALDKRKYPYGRGGAGKGPEAASEPIQLTKARFGHTFTTHGEDMTNFLQNRARGSGSPQGQFLDDQAAARLILEHQDELGQGAISVPVPDDFPARIINPDGTFSKPTHIRIVPGGKGVKTAYPEILP